ncbi:MAG: hypothetical protein IJS84_06075, partial [Spirochaetales bacterium]|nr:hypothetical protein [Spirochaetales bacterium]
MIGDVCQIIRGAEKQSSRRRGTDNVNLRVFAFRAFVIEEVDFVHPSEVIGTRILIEIHVKRFTNDPVFPNRRLFKFLDLLGTVPDKNLNLILAMVAWILEIFGVEENLSNIQT